MKIMNAILLFLFTSLLVIAQALGQSNLISSSVPSIVEERIEIQTDRQLYMTGEVLWFNIIAIDKVSNQISTLSKVGYIELIAPDGAIVTRVKTELVNGKSAGSITLPKDLSSNIYKLRSYTRMMRNFAPNSFTLKQLYVLNGQQSLIADNSENSAPSIKRIDNKVESNTIGIQLEISDQKVNQRELVELKIKTDSGETSNLAVSVSISSPSIQYINAQEKTMQGASDSNELYLPESLGIKLAGRVLNAFSEPAEENMRVYLSFPGTTALVYTALTDREGRFDFLLPRLYGQRQVVLQLDPIITSEHSIVLDEEFHTSSPVASEAFVLPDELIATANRILVNAQIVDSYKPFESVPEYIVNDKFTSLPFYGKADKTYKMDDYTRFPLPEFFFEVVPEVRVFGTFGNNHLGVFNNYSIAERQLEPLLLVDGVPVFDHKDFLSINSKLVVSSEIVKDPYWLNTVVHNGIIQILTVDGDARSFSLPASALRTSFLTFLPERQFTTPDYSTDNIGTLPDFRNTLYWNPNVTTDEHGEASIFFYTSDAIGEYEVRVEAINKLGQKGSVSKEIEVVKIIK